MTELTLEEKIKRSLATHPDWDEARVASAIRGATRNAVRAVRDGKPIPELPEPVPAGPAPTGVISLSLIQKRYDTAAAIREILAGTEPGSFISDREMCLRAAGRDIARFRRAVENNDDLKACRIKLRLDPETTEGAYYWGRKDDVQKAIKLRDE